MTMRGAVLSIAVAAAVAGCARRDPPASDTAPDTAARAGVGDTVVHTGITGGTGGVVGASDTAAVYRVNRGVGGMAAVVKWVLSPDRRSIIVMEDPASVEAEPVPNGFLYASEETGRVVQRDSVWDVTISPDWRRLAWGRAFGPRPAERDSLSVTEWRAFARRIPASLIEAFGMSLRTTAGMDSVTRVLRDRAFPASGMTYAVAIGVTHVLDLASADTVARPLRWDGWRVAWTARGDTLGIGTDPRGAQDFSPPARWIVTRPPARDSVGAAGDSSRFVRLRWTQGPTIGYGIEESPRELVATRDRRFVVALVANEARGEFDPPVRLVVHQRPPR